MAQEPATGLAGLPIPAVIAGWRLIACVHRRGAVGAAPPSRPLDGFSGDYDHPAYGTLGIAVTGDRLRADFHGAGDERIRLDHRGHDAWDLTFTAGEETCPLVFRQGSDGDVAGLVVDGVGRFDRLR